MENFLLNFLPAPLKGTLAASFLALNTVFSCAVLYVFVFLRFISPTRKLKNVFSKIMVSIAEGFISGNNFGLRLFNRIRWDVEGLDGLHSDKSYLVVVNHQSWVDIVILQRIFNRRIPFLRFFIKRQLIYVPFLGAAWVALDFPLMNRHSKSYLEKHPEKRGEDLATTRRACERFKGAPISVLNFLEGTRFTAHKHKTQRSTFENLLAPKSGGVAYILDAMGGQFDSLLDVTIYYPDGVVSLWGLLSGKMKCVVVRVEKRPIPRELLEGSYFEDEAFRDRMKGWVGGIWSKKDKLIDTLRA